MMLLIMKLDDDADDGLKSQSLVDDVLVGRVKDCMLVLAKAITNVNPCRVLTHPHRGVLATSDNEEDTLLLVPLTNNVLVNKVYGQTSPYMAKVKTPTNESTNFHIGTYLFPGVIHSPYWYNTTFSTALD